MRSIRTALFSSVSIMTLGIAGCGGGDTIAPAPEDIRDYISYLATSSGVEAVFHAGFPPAAGAGPVITLTGGGGAMITGGGALRGVTSATSFNRLIVAIEGVDGYWEITLPGSVTAEELFVNMNQEVPDYEFVINVAAAAGGVVGAYGFENVEVIEVGTGVLQVSVSWDTSADIDLYVVEPGSVGEEIYWGNTSSSFGALDLDSNAACSGDEIRNENITYPNSPPAGTYTIRVNLWAECGTTTTNFVVTVRKEGQLPVIFEGTRTAPSTPGGSGVGAVVTTFTWP